MTRPENWQGPWNADLPNGRLARFRGEDRSTGLGNWSPLAADSPPVREARTKFPKSVKPDWPRLLISGGNNFKVGKQVEKGLWAGFPIFTLTLEERSTCSKGCHHWRTCMGNGMHFARRHQAGPELEQRLWAELGSLQVTHPKGFVIRLHVLGDFYSVPYVRLWHRAMSQLPALHVFGYTRRLAGTVLGQALSIIAEDFPSRWHIRESWASWEEHPAAGAAISVMAAEDSVGAAALVCPAQLHKSETCGTCGLCWTAERNIAFITHGPKRGGPGFGRPRKQKETAQ